MQPRIFVSLVALSILGFGAGIYFLGTTFLTQRAAATQEEPLEEPKQSQLLLEGQAVQVIFSVTPKRVVRVGDAFAVSLSFEAIHPSDTSKLGNLYGGTLSAALDPIDFMGCEATVDRTSYSTATEAPGIVWGWTLTCKSAGEKIVTSRLYWDRKGLPSDDPNHEPYFGSHKIRVVTPVTFTSVVTATNGILGLISTAVGIISGIGAFRGKRKN